MNKLETRYIEECEIRADGDEMATIVGYAARFNKMSQDLGGFTEKIAKGAFKRSLGAGDDVRALVDHKPEMIVGRRSAGTLDVIEDTRGLKVTITPPDTTVGRDLVENIRLGNINQMSFAFRAVEEEWQHTSDKKPDVRTLKDVDLVDVSAVTYPAYLDTALAVRSWEAWKAENRDVTSEVTNVTSEVASAEVELDHMNAELDLLDATGSVV